jgi:hypothetical protein
MLWLNVIDVVSNSFVVSISFGKTHPLLVILHKRSIIFVLQLIWKIKAFNKH